MISRRGFLVYLGVGTYSMLRSNSMEALARAARFPSPRYKRDLPDFFSPISSTDADELVLPKGYRYDILARFGDALGSKSPSGQPEAFGYDCDFNAYFPIDALKGGTNPNEGLLWTNHEFVNSLFVSGHKRGTKNQAQIAKEKLAVGGSITRIKKTGKNWKRIADNKHTRRFTAAYPEIEMTGPFKFQRSMAVGTLANCSGGKTPWHTVLSCEENFQLFNPVKGGLGWASYEKTALDNLQYGWVVEIDPFGQLPPQKHTALGRFCHENASMRVGGSGRLVVYMGDDSKDQFLYKFVSADKVSSKKTRADKRTLLSEGTLYAADFENGRWLELSLRNKRLRGFKTQARICSETREAAKLAGATPIDRPEDCEIHPKDGSLYVALTNNSRHGNFYGQIVRLVEKGDDAEARKFQFEIFLAGGPQSGLACPDNLVFDKNANLWVCCDISSGSLNKGNYKPFGNNGVFFVSTSGKGLGEAHQFASGPVECELTGAFFNPTFDTLFLSVQHPGEKSRSVRRATSHWPDGKGAPRPAVVAISGFPS